MKQPKKRSARAIRGGGDQADRPRDDLSPEEREKQILLDLAADISAWGDEAKALDAALPKDSISEARAYIEQHPPSAGAILFMMLLNRGRSPSEMGRNTVAIRHARTNKAKEFVRDEWARCRSGYEDNKSAFARDYARIVKNKLDIEVTEKTIRERWIT